MRHCGTRDLETERLILRRFSVTDADAMYKNWASDPDVTRYLTWPVHGSAEVTRSLLESWTASYEKDDRYEWAIVLKENGPEPIGSIAAVSVNDDIGAVQIGYCLGKNWWHRGIMTEALRAVIAYFFDTVGANRIEARHDTRNPRSGMVMRGCGMQYEGTMRSSDRNNQGIADVAWYAILRSDRK